MEKQKTKFKQDEIEEKLLSSIRMLFKQDAFLMENDAHERSVSHKLAEHLQELFQDYNVDCEYNRHGKEIKELEYVRECKDKKSDRVLPDILVHIRGIDDYNLIVIEIKTSNNDASCDFEKLKLFTRHTGKYKYKFGFFIRFNGLNKPKIKRFQNGKEI